MNFNCDNEESEQTDFAVSLLSKLDMEQLHPYLQETEQALAACNAVCSMPQLDKLLCLSAMQEAVCSCSLACLNEKLTDVLRFSYDSGHVQMSAADQHTCHVIASYRTALPTVYFSRSSPELSLKLIQDLLVSLRTEQVARFKQYQSELEQWLFFVKNAKAHPLLRIALAHAGLYQLQPAGLSSGRLARLLTVFLFWNLNLLDLPVLYQSACFAVNTEEYHKRIFNSKVASTDWCRYFLQQTTLSVKFTLRVCKDMAALYQELFDQASSCCHPLYVKSALGLMFRQGFFTSSQLIGTRQLPRTAVLTLLKYFVSTGAISVMMHSSGRRPGKYLFTRALELLDPRMSGN